MKSSKTPMSRRNFLRSSALAGSGIMISFGWVSSFASTTMGITSAPIELTELNGYLKISSEVIVSRHSLQSLVHSPTLYTKQQENDSIISHSFHSLEKNKKAHKTTYSQVGGLNQLKWLMKP